MIDYVLGNCDNTKLIESAYTLGGVRWFDSAYGYLCTGGPQALGEAIVALGNPEDMNVITKVGMLDPWTPEQLDLEWAAITEHIPAEWIKILLMHGPSSYDIYRSWHTQGGIVWLKEMKTAYGLTLGMSGGHTLEECIMFRDVLSNWDNDREIQTIFMNYGRSFCTGPVADLVDFCKSTGRQVVFKKMSKLAAAGDTILEVLAHAHAAEPDMVCIRPSSILQILRDRAILEMLDYGSPLLAQLLEQLEQPEDVIEIRGT